MPTSLQQALRLQRIALCDVFTGSEVNKTPWGRVFGGQILAQSLVAAQHTVDPSLEVHSLTGYFLLAGESGVELLFEVDRVRDGRSFATRVVKAVQRNKAIFLMTCSFHISEAISLTRARLRVCTAGDAIPEASTGVVAHRTIS